MKCDSHELADVISSKPNVEGVNTSVDLQVDEHTQATPTTTTRFFDHYSVQGRSSNVRFRGSTFHIIDHNDKQLVLEEQICTPPAGAENERGLSSDVTVKFIDDTGKYMQIIRGFYTLVAFMMSGFVFITFISIIMHFFFGIVVYVGGMQGEIQADKLHRFPATLLAVPLFINGLSSAMVIVARFVADAWAGFRFFEIVSGLSVVVTEWVAFATMIGIPLFTIGVTMFAGLDNWWEKSALTWFFLVFSFFIVFTLTILYKEMEFCLELLNLSSSEINNDDSLKSLLRRVIVLHQTQRFSGVKKSSYILAPKSNQRRESRLDHFSEHQRISLYSRLTTMPCFQRFFIKLDPPVRIYGIEEVRQSKAFMTRATWSLEKSFSSGVNSNDTIVVTKGPSALTSSQLRSSLVCGLLCVLLSLFLIVALSVWMDQSAVVASGLVIIFLALLIPLICWAKKTYRMYKEVVTTRREINSGEGQTEFQVTEKYRISQPTESFCWFMYVCKTFFLIVVPVTSLFFQGNFKIGFFVMFVSIYSRIRIFFNPESIIIELGSLTNLYRASGLDTGSGENTASSKISRISLMTDKISRSRNINLWMLVFNVFITIMAVLTVLALSQNRTEGLSTPDITYLPDFEYEPQNVLAYPTCTVKKGLGYPEGVEPNLSDYAFIAKLAYFEPNLVQPGLNSWFGALDMNVTNEITIVKQFKERQEKKQQNNPVAFSFISFDVEGKKIGIVSVRGTSNILEMLVDLQLWTSAALAQMLRAVVPIGHVWDSILPTLLKIASMFSSQAVEKVAFYKHTTAFVNEIVASGNYSAVHITGHSLGGGIAIITGAQTGIPVIGLSAPNAMLSRETFSPPLTKEQLDTEVINVIPDRDPFPRIDDPGQVSQSIRCTAPANGMITCHYIVRSICELHYQCGTRNRPALCECHKKYGYPKPMPLGNRTFEDACDAKLLV